MDDRTILGLFAFLVVAAIMSALYCVNKKWEKEGIHDELNKRKQHKERWELRGARRRQK